MAVLVGYGRCQSPQQDPPQRYAVLRCIESRGDAVDERVQAPIVTISSLAASFSPSPSLVIDDEVFFFYV